MPLLKAATVSAVGALITSLMLTIFTRSGASYTPDVDWQRVEAMRYDDATAYLLDRTVQLSTWDAFLLAAPVPEYWMAIGKFAFALFLFGFVSCVVTVYWVRRASTKVAV